MRRLFRYIIIIFAVIISWPIVKNQLEQSQYGMYIQKLSSGVKEVQEHPKYEEAIDSFFESIHELLIFLDQTIELDQEAKQETKKEAAKPELKKPASNNFSIYNIEIGNQRQAVEAIVGNPQRSTMNEYDLQWSTYHQNYHNFVMVAYDKNNKVAGLYTNQDLVSSKKGITLGSSKDTVRKQLGEPLSKLEKGTFYYQFEKNRDYDVYHLDESYITFFYDKHEHNTVTAVQVINEKVEQSKQNFYASESTQLREGFEYQLFDLTNAARVKFGLPVLTWNANVTETAREHSSDMAENHFFDHQNLEGQSPFDRMKEDEVVFTSAGENLAYGQFSSIFAHEGLMNSLGHRENILRTEYEFLGVGVAFNTEAQPYYTENFFAK